MTVHDFTLPSGELCVTVGDVAGSGLTAAVIMGRMRSALRAYALETADPAEGFLKARLRTWFWPCTNWRRTPSAMVAERDGCGYGTWQEHCIARLTTVIC